MKNWQLIIDVEKCEDCNNCFLACKDEHVDNDWPGYSLPQPLHGHRWMNIMRKERGQFPMIDVAYLPIPCMHCDRAPCIEAAKGGAVYKRDDGIVIIDPERPEVNRPSYRRAPIMPSGGMRKRKFRKNVPYAPIFWMRDGKNRGVFRPALPGPCVLSMLKNPR